MEVADCTPGAGFSLKQKTASSCNRFRFPSPYVCTYACVHDSSLLLAALLETVLCGAEGRAFTETGFPGWEKTEQG